MTGKVSVNIGRGHNEIAPEDIDINFDDVREVPFSVDHKTFKETYAPFR